jgi:hypothetical protein
MNKKGLAAERVKRICEGLRARVNIGDTFTGCIQLDEKSGHYQIDAG